ncbi:NAD(P)-dependent alcohol dehydrogenase [Streptomyces antibioticus]|uniref:NADPH:quinone reductase n=2 Tax=Streptomyces antibioticus TaxID=1890 RepID=A0ABX3LBS7_STRAT|nr:NAD(P)-dependent alcohol dehydrogenase [Streptomyces antibioticus]MCX4740949.1 NAD(P)-dependent alcohol dehydrogenase [Streptomyces antibioticus]MCX5173646.1 NAD(P)-dependent alcohol dehydrogenase [Streptomyces antibioticus]OOQ48188.1 NADPH:quinone reductase [Streptomyces antibioticus]
MRNTNEPVTTDGGTTTMAAVVQDRYGAEPEAVLRPARLARPGIGPDEVLVRVRASSVDRGTWHLMAGLPYAVRPVSGLRRPRLPNPGRNIAGVVEAVGRDVTGFAPGDEVYGTAASAFAEYAAARPDRIAPKPAGLTFEEAATVPVSGLTALQAVRDKGRIRSGQQVLITGAAGGVGAFAVQLAHSYGAQVTAVASTSKLDAVRALGADHVSDYTREDFLAGPRRYDVIIDIAGNRRLRDLRRSLTPRGRLIITGGETNGRWLGGTDRQLRAQMLSPFTGQHLGTFISSEHADGLRDLTALIDAGTLRPVVDSVYPLAETAAAVRHLLDGRVIGKLALTLPAE